MPRIPPALPQFEHIKRYWDARLNLPIARVFPGEIYVTKKHELITTLLGSCVSVCMRDKINKVGGINHFKLPKPVNKATDAENMNYGIYAMELLINAIMKNGGDKKYLESTVFGGGNVSESLLSDVGDKNITFVLDFLKKDEIPVVHQDTGHKAAQQVYFHPISGHAFSAVLGDLSMTTVREAEKKYLQQINMGIERSGIDYF